MRASASSLCGYGPTEARSKADRGRSVLTLLIVGRDELTRELGVSGTIGCAK